MQHFCSKSTVIHCGIKGILKKNVNNSEKIDISWKPTHLVRESLWSLDESARSMIDEIMIRDRPKEAIETVPGKIMD